MNQELGINPWLSVWIHPRKTIRAIINYRETYRFLLLCFLNGVLGLFAWAQGLNLNASYSSLTIIIASFLLAVPYGYLNFTIMGFFFFIIGKLIKGRGSFRQVRAAISWATIPGVIGTLIWWLFRLGLKENPFLADKDMIFFFQSSYSVIGFCLHGLMIWGMVIWLHTVGEVQGFSAWMALLNFFLVFLIFAIVAVALVIIIAFLTDREGDHVQVRKTGNTEVVLAPRELFLT